MYLLLARTGLGLLRSIGARGLQNRKGCTRPYTICVDRCATFEKKGGMEPTPGPTRPIIGMLRFLLVYVLLSLSAAFVACDAADEAPPSPDSGIQGVILLGPRCPVVVESNPCPDEPFQATIDVYTADESGKMASISSGVDGRFRLALNAGDYYLDPLPPDPKSPLPVGSPLTVTVTPGEWTDVTISYDTGIR